MKRYITAITFAFLAAGGYAVTQNNVDVGLTSEAEASTDAVGVQSVLCADGTLIGYMPASISTLTVPPNGAAALGNYSVTATYTGMVDGTADPTPTVAYSTGVKDKVVIKIDTLAFKYTGLQCSTSNKVDVSSTSTIATTGLEPGVTTVTGGAAAGDLGDPLTGTALALYTTLGKIAVNGVVDGIDGTGNADDLDTTVDGSIRVGKELSLRMGIDVNDFDTPASPGLQETITHAGTIS